MVESPDREENDDVDREHAVALLHLSMLDVCDSIESLGGVSLQRNSREMQPQNDDQQLPFLIPALSFSIPFFSPLQFSRPSFLSPTRHFYQHATVRPPPPTSPCSRD